MNRINLDAQAASLRNKREDERLGLSRRSFFFFGAILAAKPEIVVPKPISYTLLDCQIFDFRNPEGDIVDQYYGDMILRGSDGFVYRCSGVFPWKVSEMNLVPMTVADLLEKSIHSAVAAEMVKRARGTNAG